MRRKTIIIILFGALLLWANSLVKTDIDTFSAVVSYSDSSAIIEWETAGDRQRPVMIAFYKDTVIIAKQRLGYCEDITSRRFGARCAQYDTFWVDSVLYKAVQDSINGGVK